MAWIAGAIAVGGAIIGGMSENNAEKKAGKQAVALYREGINNVENKTGLRQTYSPGGAAAYNQALGLLGVNNPGQPDYQGYFSQNKDLQDEWNKNAKLRSLFGNDPAKYAADHYKQFGQAEGREIGSVGGTGGAGGNAAFQNYLDSAGYKTQLNSGIDALNSNAAARGMLKSGATLKATQRFGAGLGQQYFNNYIGQLMNSANMGLAADQTLAGAYTGTAQGAAGAQQTATSNAGQAVGGAIGDASQNIAGSIILANKSGSSKNG